MAGDVAELGIVFNSEDVKKASDNLSVLEGMAKRAGVSVDEMQKRVKAAEAGFGTLKPATEQANAQLQKMEEEVARLTTELNQLKAANDNATTSMNKMSAAHESAGISADRLATGFRSILFEATAVLVGIGSLAGAFHMFISETIEAERVQAMLVATLQATNNQAGQTIESLNSMAQALQKTTTFSDEAVGAAQQILLRFSLVRENFERTTVAAADLAAGTGQDLSSAMQALGRAMEAPDKAARALRQAGIVLTASQKELIDKSLEAGDMLKAQEVILGTVEARYKGTAAAARDTLGGALAALKNAFGDLFEQTNTNASVSLRTELEKLIAFLSDPATQSAMQTFGGWIFSFITASLQGASLAARKAAEDFRQITSGEFQKFFAPNQQQQTQYKFAIGAGSTLDRGTADEFYRAANAGGQLTTVMTKLEMQQKGLIGTNDAYKAGLSKTGDAAKDTHDKVLSLNEIFINNVAAMGEAATMIEKYQAKVFKLDQQLLDGKITADAYARAISQINPVVVAVKDVVSQLGNSMADAFIHGASAAEALTRALQGMATKASGNIIDSFIKGLTGGGFDPMSIGLNTAIAVGGSLLSKLFGGDKEGDAARQKAAAEAERQRVEHEKMIAEAQIRAADYMTRAAAAMEKSDFINSIHKFDAESQKAFDEESKRAGDLAIWQLVAARAAERTKLIADTIDAATQTLAGTELSEVQTRLKEINEAATELGNALIYSGQAASDAADIVSQKLNAALDQLRGSFLNDLTRQVNDLAGGGWINQAADLALKVEQMRSDAAALGIQTSLIDEFYIRSAAKIAEQNGLTGDSLSRLEAQLGFAPGALTEFANAIQNTAAAAQRSASQLASATQSLSMRLIQATNDTSTLGGALAVFDAQAAQQRATEIAAGGQLLAQLDQTLAAERAQIEQRFATQALQAQQQAADQALQAQQQAQDAALRSQQQAAQEQQRIFDDALKFLTSESRRIADYISNLRAGASSPLSPAARLASAQSAFATNKASALLGNRDSLSGITGNAQDVLDAAKAMFGSTLAYQNIFNDIIAQLQSLPAQVSPEKFIVNAIDAQTQTLAQRLQDGFGTLDTNTDGLLTFSELQSGLHGMYSDSQLRDMFTRIDTDNSGSISKLETIAASNANINSGTNSIAGQSISIASNTSSTAGNTIPLSSINNSAAALPAINSNTSSLPPINSNTLATNALLQAVNTQITLGNTNTNSTVNAVGLVQGEIQQTNGGITQMIGLLQGIGSWAPGSQHAAGGLITGKGTGTSDSIPADWLSNGEYVINASDTARNRALLDSINYGHQMPSTGGDGSVVAAINRQTVALLGALGVLRDVQIESAKSIAAPAQEANKRAVHGRGRKVTA